MNDDEKFLGCLGLQAAIITAMILTTILGGWAVSTLWGWFIVPVFHLPSLGILQAAGIALIVSYLAKDMQPSDDKMTQEQRIAYLLAMSIFRPMWAVGFGWVIVQFL